MKFEQKLKVAREDCKANYEKAEQEREKENDLKKIDSEGTPKPKETNGMGKPPRPFDDKTCSQAPDNDSPGKIKKKEKKEFIEPNLKAFMERNVPKLSVFLNITDMKIWKKKN
jgi:hypothetical protein